MLAILVAEIWWWRYLRPNSIEPRWSGGTDLLLAIPAGVLLAATLLPQTIGLQSTSASKSGFLTTLYVLLVPVFSQVLFKYPTKARVYGYVLIALTGTALLVGLHDTREPLNPGDLWTLLCAFGAAFHILYVGQIAHRIRDGFRFNTLQSFFCLLAVLPVILFQENVGWWSSDLVAWAGVLSLAVGSSIIGFTIQVRAQRILSATTASMMFLLESPFALAFGILLLGETLTWTQAIGGVLILTAAALTLRSDSSASSK